MRPEDLLLLYGKVHKSLIKVLLIYNSLPYRRDTMVTFLNKLIKRVQKIKNLTVIMLITAAVKSASRAATRVWRIFLTLMLPKYIATA